MLPAGAAFVPPVSERPPLDRPDPGAPDGSDGRFAGLMAQFIPPQTLPPAPPPQAQAPSTVPGGPPSPGPRSDTGRTVTSHPEPGAAAADSVPASPTPPRDLPAKAPAESSGEADPPNTHLSAIIPLATLPAPATPADQALTAATKPAEPAPAASVILPAAVSPFPGTEIPVPVSKDVAKAPDPAPSPAAAIHPSIASGAPTPGTPQTPMAAVPLRPDLPSPMSPRPAAPPVDPASQVLVTVQGQGGLPTSQGSPRMPEPQASETRGSGIPHRLEPEPGLPETPSQIQAVLAPVVSGGRPAKEPIGPISDSTPSPKDSETAAWTASLTASTSSGPTIPAGPIGIQAHATTFAIQVQPGGPVPQGAKPLSEGKTSTTAGDLPSEKVAEEARDRRALPTEEFLQKGLAPVRPEAATNLDTAPSVTVSAASRPTAPAQGLLPASPVFHPPPAAPPAPVVQVEGGLRWMLRTGAQEASLQLHPGSLGQVSIHLRVEGGEVHARLWVTEATSVKTIQDGRAHLELSLKEQGLQLGSFDLQQGHRPFQETTPTPVSPVLDRVVPVAARQEAPSGLVDISGNPHQIEIYA